MPTTQVRATIATILSTEMNSLANNANAVHATSVATSGYVDAELELLVTFALAPTANTACYVWLLREVDGTNFEDGSATVTPTRNPDAIFTVRAVATAQRIIVPVYGIPPGNYRPLIRNAGTGQAFSASGNTLRIRPLSYQ